MKAATLAFAALCAGFASSAHGQSPDARVDELNEQKAYYEAVTARETARQASLARRLTPLTGLTGSGTTTLGTGAGSAEIWFLTREAIAEAGLLIAQKFPGKSVVLLSGDETLNLSQALMVRNEVDSLEREYAMARPFVPGSCRDGDTDQSLAASVPMVLGTIGNLLKSDFEVQGIEVKADHRLLAFSVASHLAGIAIVPSAFRLPSLEGSLVAAKLSALHTHMLQAAAWRACVGDDKKFAIASSALDALKTRYATFNQRLAAVDANGRSPLVDALISEAINKKDPIVLRVFIERAGGDWQRRRNLLTALGLPAVSVSGGFVGSYQATDPRSGHAVGSGTVGCVTPRMSLSRARLVGDRRTTRTPLCNIETSNPAKG